MCIRDRAWRRSSGGSPRPESSAPRPDWEPAPELGQAAKRAEPKEPGAHRGTKTRHCPCV
eukprot:4054007-Pyramimonas_sp.AAC.1